MMVMMLFVMMDRDGQSLVLVVMVMVQSVWPFASVATAYVASKGQTAPQTPQHYLPTPSSQGMHNKYDAIVFCVHHDDDSKRFMLGIGNTTESPEDHQRQHY